MAVFDPWLRNDLGRVTVQLFDEAFRTACGLPHALCFFRATCGEVLVLEHEGSARDQRQRPLPLRQRSEDQALLRAAEGVIGVVR